MDVSVLHSFSLRLGFVLLCFTNKGFNEAILQISLSFIIVIQGRVL